MDRRQYLRDHQRRGATLHGPRDHQLAARAGNAAPQRSQREAQKPEQEDRLGAANIAKPAAGDDQRREGDLIKHDDALDFGGRGVEVGADRRDRHVYDKGIDHKDELRRDDSGEHPPTALAGFDNGDC